MNILSKIYSKAHTKWKYTFNDVRSRFGLNENLFSTARGKRIVIYHGICLSDPTRFNSIFLKLKTFESHLQFYKKYFHIISLDDYYNQRFNKERFNICITFDDGFANNYKYVLPLLEKYRMPAAFFITAIRDVGYNILWNDILAYAQKYGPREIHLINDNFYKDRYRSYVSRTNDKLLKDLLQSKDFAEKAELIKYFEQILRLQKRKNEEDYWLQMTEEQIKTLSQSQFATIGCHGYYHNDLSKIPTVNVQDEIFRSKEWLESITQKSINAIAFPYGAYTREVVHLAKSAGFKQLLAMDFLFKEDNFDESLSERFTINPYISVYNQMTAIIQGKYES